MPPPAPVLEECEEEGALYTVTRRQQQSQHSATRGQPWHGGSTYVVLKSSEQSRVSCAAMGSLPASANCSETSVSIDFPDEDEDNDPAKGSTYVVLKSSEQSRVSCAAMGSLPASANCSETSVSIDFPDEDEDNDPAKVQDWGALDPSAKAKREEKWCEDETAEGSIGTPEVVITQADENSMETVNERHGKREYFHDFVSRQALAEKRCLGIDEKRTIAASDLMPPVL
ncbi:UNVERIFIED_CONTAM: hypothetical protein FKN15_053077 [Acipenser sinensis]